MSTKAATQKAQKKLVRKSRAAVSTTVHPPNTLGQDLDVQGLRESNKRFRAVLDSFDALIYICSPEHRLEFMNARMLERTGYDATGELCYKVLHNLDSACPWCVSERVFKGERVEWEVQSPEDGRWYQVVNTPVFYGEDRVSKQTSIFDITDRKQAENHLGKLIAERTTELRKTNDLLLLANSERRRANESLKKAYRQLQDIINFLPDATFVIDKKKRVIAWNRAIEEMTGVKRDDILGKGDYAYALPFYGEKRPIIIDFVMDGEDEIKPRYDVLAKKENVVFGEACVPGVYGGKKAYLWGLASPLFDHAGNIIGAIQSIRDITDRKLAERALRVSEERFRAIFESAQESIFLKDKSLRYTLINPAMEKLLGRPACELIGLTDEDIFGEGGATREADSRVSAGEVVHDQHTAMIRGEQRIFHSVKVPIRDQHGEITGLCGIVRDITEIKRSEKILKESEEKLRFLSAKLLDAQEDERRRVARDLHDTIGQYLVAIKLKIENLMKAPQSRPKGRKHSEGLEALVPLIQDALEEVRRICLGLRPSILDSLGIIATINWFCRQFRKSYDHIEIRQTIGADEREIPEHLKIVMFRIIQEGLNNIAKHSGARLVSICLSINESAIELAIENDGAGFDLQEALEKDADQRGLGLTGMRERVELSGGSFVIQSVIEEGTVIRASWPLKTQGHALRAPGL